MTALQRFVRDEGGATAVEFAIVGAIFVVLCMGLIDFGRNFDLQGRVGHAADVAARTLFLDKTATQAQITARIGAAFPTLGFDEMTLTVTNQTIGAHPYRKVTVSMPLHFLTPGFLRRGGTISVDRIVPVG
ncbi:TadE/TadG family type IV pilus assembly protein [Paragemmobacter straminiformis]|uniref:Pilus assembly protein n=1 Tax=Paragemmobacter straminiformis TaxID=2045119 RepID=A0A842I828_9RHOB|nr:TadE family protein [Gemmobacter straminiformis]MBC2835785.1 pilus assembly protein [Gemmobacter straminiformis]